MHKYNFPMTDRGVLFHGSRHEDNHFQFILCYTIDTGDAVENKKSFMRNFRRWNIHGKDYTQTVASSVYDYFETQGLVPLLINDPAMVNATFYEMGQDINHA